MFRKRISTREQTCGEFRKCISTREQTCGMFRKHISTREQTCGEICKKDKKKETHLSVISRVYFYYVITFISFIQVYFSKAACFSLGNKRALRDC